MVSLASKRENSDLNRFFEFSLVLCTTLLVEPRTNFVYFAALFLPVISLLLLCWGRRAFSNRVFLTLILIFGVLTPLVPGASQQRLFLVLGFDLFFAIIVWAALGFNLAAPGFKKIPADSLEPQFTAG